MNEATQEDYQAWVNYLSKTWLAFPVRVRLKPTLVLGQIWISMDGVSIPDVSTGKKRPEYRSRLAPSLRPSAKTKHWIREYLLDFVLHEFGEHLHINGERPFDPHLNDPGF